MVFAESEKKKLLDWLEKVSRGDFIAMSQLILAETGSEYQIRDTPQWVSMYYWQVQIEIQRLSLQSLRRLNSLIDLSGEAEDGKAA